MQILGFNISKSISAAEQKITASVSIPSSLQQTQPSIPLKSASPRAQLGDSGTLGTGGIIFEEYNAQLQGIQGVKKFDEMRKSDGTVRAAMLVTSLPIRRAEWYVKPAGTETQDEEVAEFVQSALMEWIEGMTWDDVLRQALLMLPFGVMCFEKVYGVKEFDGKQYVTLKKLAPRLPKSIMQWELNDKTFGIQQIRQDGVLAQIPGSKLLIFVNEREGDNWWGTSMLRAAYKHWYYKDKFYKIDAMAFERQGMGVPVMKMPQGYTESDERKAKTVLENLRADGKQYIIMPTGYEFEFANMGAGSTRDPQNSISHHNKEILQSVLAQFLELGMSAGGSGSRAVSMDHSELFLKAMEAIAGTIVDEFNKNLIPELVDLNFNDIQKYPKLDFAGIEKVDMQSLATAYSALVTAGAITPTDDDQQYIRGAMGLPPRTQEDIDAGNEEPEEVAPVSAQPNQDGVDDAIEEDVDVPGEVKKVEKATKKKAHEHGIPLAFTAGDGFVSWRKLTFAEEKVNWKKIEDTINEMEKNFTAEARRVLSAAKDVFMVKLHKAIATGDQKAITDLTVSFTKEYKDVLKSAMKDAYAYGKNNASTEIGVQPPANTATSMQTIDLMADAVASKMASDFEAKAKLAAANALKQDVSSLQASGSIDAMLDEAISKAVNSTAGIIVGQNINGGRNDVFERNGDKIYALQRSEVLDNKTCDFCLSMDGLVVELADTWARTDTFHDSCRGIWVAIMKEELNPPAVTGVPDELASYYGGQPNALVQPPRPMLQPGSPATDEVARRKEDKKK